jgi:Concanavalin A-like lectin/glucanases superfamily
LNTWHHFAATYDGAMVKIYIDGVLATSAVQTGAITTNTNPLTIGNQPGFPEFFGGSVDEVRIWKVARTQAQIQANMNSEIDPAVQTNLVSYYTFDQGITSGTNTGLVPLIDHNATSNGTLTNFAMTGAASNFVPQVSTLIPLPLQWLGFTVQNQNNGALLEWSTASEENTKDFVIQRSANGIAWDSIGVVSAKGNSNSENDYRFVDNNPANGMNYYRLLQKDMDGRGSYSNIREIQFNLVQSLLVFNNPVTNGLLQVKLNLPAHLLLYSNDGKLLWQGHLNPGSATIDMSGYTKGTYLLKANDQVSKIIVQ